MTIYRHFGNRLLHLRVFVYQAGLVNYFQYVQINVECKLFKYDL